MTNCAELKTELAQFTGSEHLYFNPLYRQLKYTDGVKYFAERAGTYWLLDIIGTEFHPKTTGENPKWDYFLSISLRVKDSQAQIKVTDGNEATFASKTIAYTDCPKGDWHFYLTDNVLMLASEY